MDEVIKIVNTHAEEAQQRELAQAREEARLEAALAKAQRMDRALNGICLAVSAGAALVLGLTGRIPTGWSHGLTVFFGGAALAYAGWCVGKGRC